MKRSGSYQSCIFVRLKVLWWKSPDSRPVLGTGRDPVRTGGASVMQPSRSSRNSGTRGHKRTD